MDVGGRPRHGGRRPGPDQRVRGPRHAHRVAGPDVAVGHRGRARCAVPVPARGRSERRDGPRPDRGAVLPAVAHQTFQDLESINRELEVLSQAPAAPTEHAPVPDDIRRRIGAPEDEYTEKLDRPLGSLLGQGGPLLAKNGKPLQPFTIVGGRQDLRKGVFRPGHNLPTMSIDEYLDEERRQGNIIEGGGEASYARPEPDEDDYEKADAEMYKARDWDEYQEANPRGSGNTLNMG